MEKGGREREWGEREKLLAFSTQRERERERESY